MPYVLKIHMHQDPAFAREVARETSGQVFTMSSNADTNAGKRGAKKANAALWIAKKITERKAEIIRHTELIEKIHRAFHDAFRRALIDDMLAYHDVSSNEDDEADSS